MNTIVEELMPRTSPSRSRNLSWRRNRTVAPMLPRNRRVLRAAQTRNGGNEKYVDTSSVNMARICRSTSASWVVLGCVPEKSNECLSGSQNAVQYDHPLACPFSSTQ